MENKKTPKKTTISWTNLLAAENIVFTPGKRIAPFSPVKQEDAGPKLRVIGADLPMTGTKSLKAALEILGFGPVLDGYGGERATKPPNHYYSPKDTRRTPYPTS